MNRYVIGSAATGEILRSVYRDSSQLEAQAQPGEVLDLSDDADPSTHYFRGADIVAYTPEQAAAKAQRRPDSTWSNESMSWVDHRTLEQARLDQWNTVKAIRDKLEYGGFVWDGSKFDSDRQAQRRIQGATQLALLAKLAGIPFEVDWTLADNTVRTLSGDDMLAVGRAMGALILNLHSISREMRIAIQEATNSAGVGAVLWTREDSDST